jgi:hypothetical protein
MLDWKLIISGRKKGEKSLREYEKKIVNRGEYRKVNIFEARLDMRASNE